MVTSIDMQNFIEFDSDQTKQFFMILKNLSTILGAILNDHLIKRLTIHLPMISKTI